VLGFGVKLQDGGDNSEDAEGGEGKEGEEAVATVAVEAVEDWIEEEDVDDNCSDWKGRHCGGVAKSERWAMRRC